MLEKQHIEALYEILLIIACSDGEIHDNEVEVLDNFVKTFDENKSVDINFHKEKVLNQQDETSFADLFKKDAQVLKDVLSDEEKDRIIDFLLEMIAADGKIEQNENTIFNLLLTEWGMENEDLTKIDEE